MTEYSQTEILGFLEHNPIMNIAVVDGDKPIASVVLFCVDKDFTFYFAAHESSYKSKALRNNSKISLSIWEHNKMLVQADGNATIVPMDKVESVLDRLATVSIQVKDFWPPLLSLENDSYTVFAVKTTWLRILKLKDMHINEVKDYFQILQLK